MQRIEVPRAWSQPQVAGPTQPTDEEFAQRIEKAAQGLQHTIFDDRLRQMYNSLLAYGLVPLLDTSAPTSSIQTQVAKKVVKLVHIGGVQYQTGHGPLAVKRPELILLKAAHFFRVEIILFSSRKQVHRYRPLVPPRLSIALLSVKDRFASMSELVVLVRSKSRPSHRALIPPPSPPNIPPASKYSPATKREVPRQRVVSRYDHEKDLEAFHLGWYVRGIKVPAITNVGQKLLIKMMSYSFNRSIEKIRDDARVAVKKLVNKNAYKKKQPFAKEQEQREVCEGVRTKALNGATLPNGILDRAAGHLPGGEGATSSRKKAMQPTDSRVRVERWRDIVRSGVYYDIWKEEWLAHSTDPVIDNPFPPHQPMHNYAKHLCDLQQTIDQVETGEEQAKPTSLRTCSSTFKNVIRPEHVMSGNDMILLQRIESVQSSISSVISEIYTAAHMATLLVSGSELIDGLKMHGTNTNMTYFYLLFRRKRSHGVELIHKPMVLPRKLDLICDNWFQRISVLKVLLSGTSQSPRSLCRTR